MMVQRQRGGGWRWLAAEEKGNKDSMKMQASILSLVFKLAELISIKAHNSINQSMNSINSKA
jgi:hypothetical protein